MRSDDVVFCGQCGGEMTTGTGTAGTTGTASTAVPDPHAGCRAARIYEPPRYCEACGRRMVVQVTPSGWAARCVEHGVVDG